MRMHAQPKKKTVGICDYHGLNGVTLQVSANLISDYHQASHAQQTAELYGVAVSVAAAAVSHRSCLIFTDNAACAAWLSGAKIPIQRHQAHLLLAASILQTLCRVDCSIRWTPGEMNPADYWSRRELKIAQDDSLS